MATYCSSDWHAAHWAWTAVKEFLKPDDKLIYLGDACDRGEGLNRDGGWQMLKEMLADKRVIYLLGNHDAMLANVIADPNNYKAVNLLWQNGGNDTMNAAIKDPEAKEVMWKFRRLSTYLIYTRLDSKTVFMSHSGCTDIENEHDLLWDRNEYITYLNFTNYDYVIHGHTSAQHIQEDLENINEFLSDNKKFKVPKYNGGAYFYYTWRCCVDCGTIHSSSVVLLDLDTFEEHIFQRKEDN